MWRYYFDLSYLNYILCICTKSSLSLFWFYIYLIWKLSNYIKTIIIYIKQFSRSLKSQSTLCLFYNFITINLWAQFDSTSLYFICTSWLKTPTSIRLKTNKQNDVTILNISIWWSTYDFTICWNHKRTKMTWRKKQNRWSIN
jgi:hypothetical protein